MNAPLNVLDVSTSGSHTTHSAYVLHGILGSAKNWRTFGRRLAARFPSWNIFLVDLRNHGDSPQQGPPNRLADCADDLDRLALSHGRTPDLVIGHSFGGKVALEWAKRDASPSRVTWVLDTNPGAAPTAAGSVSSTQVLEVLQALEEIPQPLSSRDALVAWLGGRGFSPVLANWMTTNLRRDDDGFRWRFHLPGVKEMIADYANQDYLKPLEGGSFAGDVHVVRASRTSWPPEDISRLAAMAANRVSSFNYHVLPDCGHWVHVERPSELLELLSPTFRR